MICPHCAIDNVSGLTACGRCGTLLPLPTDPPLGSAAHGGMAGLVGAYARTAPAEGAYTARRGAYDGPPPVRQVRGPGAPGGDVRKARGDQPKHGTRRRHRRRARGLRLAAGAIVVAGALLAGAVLVSRGGPGDGVDGREATPTSDLVVDRPDPSDAPEPPADADKPAVAD